MFSKYVQYYGSVITHDWDVSFETCVNQVLKLKTNIGYQFW